jgi:hypothetical protein
MLPFPTTPAHRELILVTASERILLGDGSSRRPTPTHPGDHAIPFLITHLVVPTPMAYPVTLGSRCWRSLDGLNPVAGVDETHLRRYGVSMDSGTSATHGPDKRYRIGLRTRYPKLRDAVATPDGNARPTPLQRLTWLESYPRTRPRQSSWGLRRSLRLDTERRRHSQVDDGIIRLARFRTRQRAGFGRPPLRDGSALASAGG